MSQSMLLPAFVALFGIGAALFLVGFRRASTADDAPRRRGDATAGMRRLGGFGSGPAPQTVSRAASTASGTASTMTTTTSSTRCRPRPPRRRGDPRRGSGRRPVEPETEPLATHKEHPRPAPAENWRTAPVESWRSLLDDMTTTTELEPIGLRAQRLSRRRRTAVPAGRGIRADPRHETVLRRHRHLRRVDLSDDGRATAIAGRRPAAPSRGSRRRPGPALSHPDR